MSALNEDLYREDLAILRRAVEEPIRQMIVVEVTSPSQTRQIARQIFEWNASQDRKAQFFFDSNTTDAATLCEQCHEATQDWANDDFPGLLVIGDESPANVRIQDKNSRQPTLLRFWRTMNQLREQWEELPTQTIFLITSEQYPIFSTEADHFKRWIPLKLHWLVVSPLIHPSTKRSFLPFAEIFPQGIYVEDDFNDKDAAQKNWLDLLRRLPQAMRRGHTGDELARRYYLPLMASAIALGKWDEAINYDGKLKKQTLPIKSRLRWLRLRAFLAYEKLGIEEAINISRQRLELANSTHSSSDLIAALWTLRYFLVEDKQWDEVEKVIKKALNVEPKNGQFLSSYATFLHQIRNDNENAEKFYKSALEIEPNNVSSLANYATFLWVIQHDAEKAETIYKRVLEIKSDDVDSLTNYANLIYDVHHDAERAENFYKKALSINPKSVDALANYADFLYRERNDINRAEDLYKDALNNDPNRVFVINDYATLLSSGRKDYDQAEKLYKRALEIEPDRVISLSDYAAFLHENRHDDENAEKMYKRALEINPCHANALGNYANFTRFIRNKNDEAERMYKKALEIDPEHANNLCNYAGFLYDVRHNNSEAKKLYEKALSVDKKNINVLDSYAGFLSHVCHDSDQAEKLYVRALEHASDNIDVLNHYANFLCLERGDYYNAEPYALKSAELAINDASKWISYGAILLLQDKSKEADEVLKKAQTLSNLPEDSAVAIAFHRYLYFYKQTSDTLSALKRLLKKGWTSPGWTFDANIEDAKKHGHPQGKLLDALALVIAGKAPLSSLNKFVHWRTA